MDSQKISLLVKELSFLADLKQPMLIPLSEIQLSLNDGNFWQYLSDQSNAEIEFKFLTEGEMAYATEYLTKALPKDLDPNKDGVAEVIKCLLVWFLEEDL
jgi:hypothetical protein